MSEEKKEIKFSVPTNIKQYFVPVLVVVAIGLAFFSGSLWGQVKTLEKGGTNTLGATTTTQTAPAAAPTVSLDTIKGLFSKGLVTFGDANRKVLFVEMADPSCPFCHAADGLNHTIYKSLGATFQLVADGGSYVSPTAEMRKLVDSGQASYVYIYYPGHGNGQLGMEALYCANEQGKFWQVHDLLMSDAGYTLMNTTVLNDKSKAGQVGDFLKSVIDPNFITSCITSGKYDARLTSDANLATSLGIQGTPNFYVNTTNYPGAVSWSDMQSTVNAALK